MSYYVTLGCSRKISLGRYTAAWKTCLALPPETSIGRGVSGWDETAGQALAELRKGLEERINKHLPWYGKGRKWSWEWQVETRRAASALNTPRLVIRWLPAHLRHLRPNLSNQME
jgi:hypothetical protein